MERNMFDLVIPYMEQNYNASANIADRSFSGLSKGTTLIVKRRSNIFWNQKDAGRFCPVFIRVRGGFSVKTDPPFTVDAKTERTRLDKTEDKSGVVI